MRKTFPFNINLIPLIACAVFALSGCMRTEGTLKIKGKITDEITKAGIPWKSVIVQSLENLSDTTKPVETGQFLTDSTGSFVYTLRKVKDAHYYRFCITGDPDYIFTTRTLGLWELTDNSEFLSFSLARLTDLTIKLYRKSTKPACDTIRLIWESDGIYGGSLYPYKRYNYGKEDNSFGQNPGYELVWIGGKVNSTITTKVFAGKKTKLTWELYRYGRRTIFVDTITCKRDFENISYFSY
jgi:hypothetical protein